VLQTRELSFTQGSGDKTGDSVRNGKLVTLLCIMKIDLINLFLANESDPPLTPPPGIITPPLKQIEAGTQRKALSKKTLPRNQNGSGNDSTLENVKLILHF